MKRTLLLDLPALSSRLLDALPAERRPAWLSTLITRGRSLLEPVIPAVTMTVQSTIATGTSPDQHGIIANGLPTCRLPDTHKLLDTDSFADYRKNVAFWEQSDKLVQQPRFWKKSGQSVALICVQSSILAADIVVTPKPTHTPDGKTIPDCWTNPPSLNDELKAKLGPFPLMNYWGPLANIKSSQWIVSASQHVWQNYPVDLQWVYIPHLDYDAQRLGPSDPKLVNELANVLNVITPLVETALRDQARVVLFSEYGMTDVKRSVTPNIALRHAGLLTTQPVPVGRATVSEIDFQRTPAFALVDHQIAHVYCRDQATADRAEAMFRTLPGIEEIFHKRSRDRAQINLDSDRAGDLVLLASEDAWFQYRWWDDWADAPAYAWSVDIHRKPGYDPAELFFDPANRRIHADKPQLVKGSHGVRPADIKDWPVLLGIENVQPVTPMTAVAALLQ